jgi:outer membrane protein OmpA-like peptidoglycan-associated protein
MTRKFFIFGFLLAALTASVRAETVVHYREGERVDPLEVARILGGAARTPIKTRSIRLLDQPQAQQPAAAALSVPVQFGFDSADILPSARNQLDAIAEGIKLLPAEQSVLVEGHTDGIGPDTYNLNLSQRRAAAVKSYLTRVHGIDEKRLKDVGFGEYLPIEGLDPNAPRNRRVQFRGM